MKKLIKNLDPEIVWVTILLFYLKKTLKIAQKTLLVLYCN